MGKKSRGKKNRVRVFPPEVLKLFQEICGGDSDAVRFVTELTEVMESYEYLDLMRRLDETAHAGILIIAQHAARSLKEGKSCDFCPSKALHLRFFVLKPSDTDPRAVTPIFSILCDPCSQISEEKLRQRLTEKCKGYLDAGDTPTCYAALVGHRVGGVESLPPGRNLLQKCFDCGCDVWILQDARELNSIPESEMKYMCYPCAQRREENGKLLVNPFLQQF